MKDREVDHGSRAVSGFPPLSGFAPSRCNPARRDRLFPRGDSKPIFPFRLWMGGLVLGEEWGAW